MDARVFDVPEDDYHSFKEIWGSDVFAYSKPLCSNGIDGGCNFIFLLMS